ncbi:MdtA/MuxA family multidrug efflux RND transporter periplasmic adaptor subunit [Candidatus Methylobacter oryzae]|uniref:MdtA/MuxA family multidrug efflux RND transporter periplasmic adaptor subunit n=1 Tax=Candidatus Methylobacter oryzae TaxID=2497749 RepID=A0ABY3CEK2_9GAMM|nr:MdtA/MuxA family multidrug efflux RND transporter periplasmic adaptor subunit [Candidatus Methylobacter oryzae]TRX01615.1 MdtA/MuxA family multidrug efflux RND transporter periplasmic adaptor subunit [Candidatus Methylobacter oryzae]
MSQNHSPELSPNRSRTLLWSIALVVLVVIAAVFYFRHPSSPEAKPDAKRGAGMSKKGGKQHDDDSPAVVAIETAVQADFPVYLDGLGTVTALRTVTVRPRVDGELVKVAFNEGQVVKEGDLLAEIDPRPFQVQLQQAEGQLMRDEALLKNAEIDHARYLTLLEQDSIAAQQTVTQEAQVKQYRGVVEMDKAQVNNAKLQLNYARLTAPISGRVGLRQIDQGNIVHANDTNGLVVITQMQPITVVFTLPEDKVQAVIQRWRTNEPVSVTAYDRAGKTKLAEGKLLALDNQIDPTTGTLKLKAQFDNNERTLFANQFVNIKMHLDTLRGAILVSSAAIQHDTQGAFVYAVNPQLTVQVRRITLGPTEDDKTVVLSNLGADETVVVEGVDRLHEGSQVDIAKKDGQAVAADPNMQAKPEDKPRKKDKRP